MAELSKERKKICEIVNQIEDAEYVLDEIEKYLKCI